jgi:hypothetical protein
MNMPKFSRRNAIIAALGLVVLIAAFLFVRPATVKKSPLAALGPTPTAPAPHPPVSDADYRSAVISAFSVFKVNDPISVENVRNRLLGLVAPAIEKETHLALVLKLTAYDDALRSGGSAEKTYKNLIALVDKDEWLKSAAPFSKQ